MKHLQKVYFIALVVFIFTCGSQVFAQEEKFFLSTIKVKDERPSGSKPSAEEIAKRFALVLENSSSNQHSAKEMVNGAIAQIIGKINENTTFRVTYTSPEGKTVDIIKKISAWDEVTATAEFTPPVKQGDDAGEKHLFYISLKTYDDPDPEFTGKVQDALLEVTILKYSNPELR